MNTYIPIPTHPKQGSPPTPKRLANGFTLIELLVAIAIIGIVAATMIPSLVQARRTANDKAAISYAHNVYKVAQAYVADNPIEINTVPTDCNTLLGYVAGAYNIQRQSFILTCTLNTEGSRIEVSYSGGTRDSLVLGQ